MSEIKSSDLVIEHEITVEDYNRLRDEVGWGALPIKQAQNGLDHSKYVIAIRREGRTIASARILWDEGYVVYVCDVMVSPDYQKQGIGQLMLKDLLGYVKEHKEPEWKIMVCLMAAKGKEEFYMKFGFDCRPTESLGAGLTMWL